MKSKNCLIYFTSYCHSGDAEVTLLARYNGFLTGIDRDRGNYYLPNILTVGKDGHLKVKRKLVKKIIKFLEDLLNNPKYNKEKR